MSAGWPVVLSSSVDIAEGETKDFDVERLSNTFSAPLLIDEVRFTIKTPSVLTVFPSGADFSGHVKVKMAMNGMSLTGTYWTPVGLLGPLVTIRDLHSGLVTGLVDSSKYNFNHYVWKFRKPLVVPEGGVLDAQGHRIRPLSQSPSASLGGNLTLNIAYAGRVMGKGFQMPDKIDVPFATHFEKNTTSFSAPQAYTSLERELANPFKVPLSVYGLAGKIQKDQRTGSLVFTADVSETTDPVTIKISQAMPSGVMDLTKDYIHWSGVFDPDRAFWVLNSELPPNCRFIADVKANYTTLTENYSFFVGLVGSREEVL